MTLNAPARTRHRRRDDRRRPRAASAPPRRPGRRARRIARDAAQPSVFHAAPSAGRIARARLAVCLCIVLWMLYIVTVIVTLARGGALSDAAQLLSTSAFLLSVTLLTFSACMYLLARAAALPRFAAHRRVRRVDLDAHFAHHSPTLTALLPSRAEDPDLVRMALWSVALQEFGALRIVLLLDDDPHPSDADERAVLDRSRALTAELVQDFAPPRARAEYALERLRGEVLDARTTEIVMREHAAAAAWLRGRADAEPPRTHVETFFVDRVLRGLAADLDATATALHEAAEAGEPPLPRARAEQLLLRIVRIFSVEATVFERKRFASLSHEPNKAMNLNSYLQLLGGRYRVVSDGITETLVPAGDAAHETGEIIDVPESDYILTLDADSMLLPEYCLRLVLELERAGNERVAVMQTPYSAYRGAPSRIERLAGATTDLQHIVHQGLSAFGATFWVGANAILRREALTDLRRESVERGMRVVRFISDRTAIEDTDSSLDLAIHGWSLRNYPERLSYSATPPDFGALVIQRRRWADGGLLVLPRLHDLIQRRRRAGTPLSVPERLLRANYLGSIAWVTLGLIAILTLYPLDGQLVTVLLLLIVLPYFVEMASDLHHLGYRRRDVVGVYGLNLLLLTVNLAGTIGSIGQALTGRKARFVRTPKVHTRTSAPALMLVAPLLLTAGATVIAVRGALDGAWGTTVFAGITALSLALALVRLVGIRNTLSDIWWGWLNWIWVAADAAPAPAHAGAARWASIIDDGPLEAMEVAR
ncbi:glycosyltransferase family 2 protein [Microbacterium sp. cx-55]|uniref:glycosyltransferase family 2 protein n=1 Tax=unclassified Microbacterium TaxID=2609290 RepID=UPI001CBBBEDD|nr:MULTISPECIES: glycosyltransferase family 2 protein [unclassified Microbacterium]MBZ4487735.1 glycosyltransferase family 2 protein [Microbacterium sp. cx-55]MCC4909250.1 glycosyltransferase family 2 protein [Microbacterium sp. cx-59]UGB34854.1 glycosyltransferase family 2 protein [Microbacterium sp. cx-55]